MTIAGKRRRSPIVIAPHRNVLEKVASHQRFINASNKMMLEGDFPSGLCRFKGYCKLLMIAS